jgi:hypothetical protein
MNAGIQKRYSLGFAVILSVFTMIYFSGAIYTLLSWLGVQWFDPSVWQRNALPL